MNEEIMNPEPAGMFVNEKMKEDLLSAKKWAGFLLSLRCLSVIFLVFYALFLLILGSSLGGATPLGGAFGVVFGILMLVLAAAVVYLIIKGFQFVYGIEEACYTNDVSSAERGFAGMRAFLRCWGILTIVVISADVLFLVVAGIMGAAARSGALH